MHLTNFQAICVSSGLLIRFLGMWDVAHCLISEADHRSTLSLTRQNNLQSPLEVLIEIISAYAEEDLPKESRATWWPNMGEVVNLEDIAIA